MRDKMTVFYKLKNLELVNICGGVQTLAFFAYLDQDIVEAMYGCFQTDKDEFVITHMREFELIKDSDENFKLQMKEDSKSSLSKYLEMI